MDIAQRQRLIASLEAGRLVAVCGAGLSMAPPTRAPSAVAVSRACFDSHLAVEPGLDPNIRDDLEQVADHFYNNGQLQTYFIRKLVDWNAFTGEPNAGHVAIADFLITRALNGALSANYDDRIETAGKALRADLNGALSAAEANADLDTHSPLLKFHGCGVRSRPNTVWTRQQLHVPPVQDSVADCAAWINANLRGRDLLVLGFWTDWAYLNEIIERAVVPTAPVSITVVDPQNLEALQAKAPGLWALAQQVQFHHIAESASDVLNELRVEYSRIWLRKMVAAGRVPFEAAGHAFQPHSDAPNFDAATLYEWRKDAEGKGPSHPARKRIPENCEAVGLAHLKLRQAGAIAEPVGYALNGEKIRVVNGAGAVLSTIQQQFTQAPALASSDRTICAGAIDLGVKANIAKSGQENHIVRNAPSGNWQTFDVAMQELGL